MDWLSVASFGVSCFGALSTLAFIVNRTRYRPQPLLHMEVRPFAYPTLVVRMAALQHPVEVMAAWITTDPFETGVGPIGATEPIKPDHIATGVNSFGYGTRIRSLMNGLIAPLPNGAIHEGMALIPKKPTGTIKFTVIVRIPDGYIPGLWDMFPSRIIRRTIWLNYDLSKPVTEAGDDIRHIRREQEGPIDEYPIPPIGN